MSDQPPERTHVAEAGNLRPGDVVTALSTPDGPWMRVRRLDRSRRVVVVTDGDEELVEVPIGQWQDKVLRRDR